jgi:Chaperone of endosialidase
VAYNFNQMNVKEKIGVGTETPTEALEVKGNIKLNSGVAVSEFSSDGTLAIVNDRSVPTTQSVKTYVDKQIATANAAGVMNTNTQIAAVNAALTTKADTGGSSTQDFQANNLKVQGNFEVTGITTFRNIEQHEGDVELGNEDSDRTIIRGALESNHSSGILQINSSVNIASTLTANGNVGIGTNDSLEANLTVYSTTQNAGNNTAVFRAPNIGPNQSHVHWGTTGDWYIRSAADNGKVILQDNGGEVGLYAGNLSFGASVRQMIDLWNKEYGIGVQAGTTYFRSGGNFAWFLGGVHNDEVINPGGGVKLMSLNGAGDLCLSARTNPTSNPELSPCRALVDGGNTLVVNWGGDYSQGVEIFNGRFVSSRQYKENIAELSTQEATIALKDLNPVKFSYKTDQSENLHVGFIAEDVPDLLAAHDKRSIGPLDVVAVLTKVVQEQQSTIASLIDRLNVLESKQA